MTTKLQRFKKSMLCSMALFASLGVAAQTQITDEEGLKAIANDPSGSYVLANDITLSEAWTPIASFSGTLDGAGYSINGLRIAGSGDNVGFFSRTNGATIKNLRVVGAQVGVEATGVYIGILVGIADGNTIIDDCFTSGVVLGRDHVGGIVGSINGTLSNNFSSAATFSGGYQAGGLAGGVVSGNLTNNVFVGQVYCTGDWGGVGGLVGIVQSSDGTGILNLTGNVSAPFALGIEKNQNHHMFALVGMPINGTINIDNSLASDAIRYYAGTRATGDAVSQEDLDIINTGKYGGKDPKNIQGTVTADATLKQAVTYTNLGFDASVWSVADGRYPVLQGMTVPFSGDFIVTNNLPEFFIGTMVDLAPYSTFNRTVTITSSNPEVVEVDGTTLKGLTAGTSTVTLSTVGDGYVAGYTKTFEVTVNSMDPNITTANDFMAKLKQNPVGEFNLTADLDFADVDFAPLPEFSGKLHGNGHVIRNLKYSNTGTNDLGLFSTTRDALIEDLGFENTTIVGNNNVGLVAGHVYGSEVRRVFVVNSYIEGRDHVGSIVGDLSNNNGVGSTISDCISNADVKTREFQVGGIAGIATGGTLQNSLFCGTIYNDGTSSNTGLISWIDSDDATIIQNCVTAASHVEGGKVVPRIVNGARTSTVFNNNYALKSTIYNGSFSTATDDANGAEGATVSDADARTQNFYQNTLGWDFDNTWTFLPNADGLMFPVLKIMRTPLQTRIIDDEFTSALVYQTGAEFKNLGKVHGTWGQKLDFQITEGANLVEEVEGDDGFTQLYCSDENGVFLGTGTLVIQVNLPEAIANLFTVTGSTKLSVDVINGNADIEISTPQQFARIGANPTGSFKLTADIDMTGVDFLGFTQEFAGTLDGNGHHVKNISLSFAGGNYRGLFSKTTGATIKNIAFENINIQAPTSNSVGLIASAIGTTFEQVAVTGIVVGRDHVGLIAGDGNGVTVRDCYVDGNVTAYSQAAGFFGVTQANGADIQRSYFNGNVTVNNYGWAGGFVGLIDAPNSTVTIQNCVSIGNINNAGRSVGQFIGGNGAGNTPNAVIIFKGNISNMDAVLDGNANWPSKNETAEGGEVTWEDYFGASELQNDPTQYTLINWDFDKVWGFDTASSNPYPVLKSLGGVVTAIESINGDKKPAQTGIYDLQGRRIENTTNLTKGVYIINGRKVVVK